MKYKVGDKVRIKSLDWYNENKSYETGNVYLSMSFVANMSKYCGQVATIIKASGRNEYKIDLDNGYYNWSGEMFEGLVEEETKPNIIEEATAQCDIINDTYICPEGYVFKDENGNVINTTKIVLEKKKPKYPKTYGECAKIMGVELWNTLWGEDATEYEEQMEDLMDAFIKLKVCRDAYWKIAGDEMELGKPWETGSCKLVYGICRDGGNILKRDNYWGDTDVFEFPLREMRDAFYENFKELIENCEEFL